MREDTYIAGDQVKCIGIFTDTNKSPVDPTTITFKLKKADGSLVEYETPDVEIVKDAVGLYHVLYVILDDDPAKRWTYRFAGTGNVIGADEDTFWVAQTAF
jgi:uncharacterized protein YfaS (alpha-2-macroglobulin family)